MKALSTIAAMLIILAFTSCSKDSSLDEFVADVKTDTISNEAVSPKLQTTSTNTASTTPVYGTYLIRNLAENGVKLGTIKVSNDRYNLFIRIDVTKSTAGIADAYLHIGNIYKIVTDTFTFPHAYSSYQVGDDVCKLYKSYTFKFPLSQFKYSKLYIVPDVFLNEKVNCIDQNGHRAWAVNPTKVITKLDHQFTYLEYTIRK